MTETEWLACVEPEQMLRHMGNASERKLRLFAVACCRCVLREMLNQHCRKAVEVAERYADWRTTWPELREANRSTRIKGPCHGISSRAAAHAATRTHARDAASGVVQALSDRFREVRAASPSLCDLLREIFGPEPFRPLEVSPAWFTWHNGAIPQMAQTIYDERRFEDLPVLADALEEAGCTDSDILSHCRWAGEHVRGCWVVDLILAKE